jgi:hypothetical protein
LELFEKNGIGSPILRRHESLIGPNSILQQKAIPGEQGDVVGDAPTPIVKKIPDLV